MRSEPPGPVRVKMKVSATKGTAKAMTPSHRDHVRTNTAGHEHKKDAQDHAKGRVTAICHRTNPRNDHAKSRTDNNFKCAAHAVHNRRCQ